MLNRGVVIEISTSKISFVYFSVLNYTCVECKIIKCPLFIITEATLKKIPSWAQ
jgi:hypothetical protein